MQLSRKMGSRVNDDPPRVSTEVERSRPRSCSPHLVRGVSTSGIPQQTLSGLSRVRTAFPDRRFEIDSVSDVSFFERATLSSSPHRPLPRRCPTSATLSSRRSHRSAQPRLAASTSRRPRHRRLQLKSRSNNLPPRPGPRLKTREVVRPSSVPRSRRRRCRPCAQTRPRSVNLTRLSASTIRDPSTALRRLTTGSGTLERKEDSSKLLRTRTEAQEEEEEQNRRTEEECRPFSRPLAQSRPLRRTILTIIQTIPHLPLRPTRGREPTPMAGKAEAIRPRLLPILGTKDLSEATATAGSSARSMNSEERSRLPISIGGSRSCSMERDR